MQKILVFGNSGSGKSTFARSYSEQHNIKHLDLDSIVWEPGTIAVQRNPDAINKLLQSFMASEPEWIIEGCYGELIQTAAASCTELIFLNPG
jgi:adenylate kinase family enzyme